MKQHSSAKNGEMSELSISVFIIFRCLTGVEVSFCSLIKGITLKTCMLRFVLINSSFFLAFHVFGSCLKVGKAQHDWCHFDQVCDVTNVADMFGRCVDTWCHEPAFSCSSLVETEPAWLCMEKLRFEYEKYVCCMPVDRTIIQSLKVECWQAIHLKQNDC